MSEATTKALTALVYAAFGESPDAHDLDNEQVYNLARTAAESIEAAGTRKLETCRVCLDRQRDRGDWDSPGPPADFILWGKLLSKEHLGPRCFRCTEKALGPAAMGRIDQYAVFDLRPLRKAVSP